MPTELYKDKIQIEYIVFYIFSLIFIFLSSAQFVSAVESSHRYFSSLQKNLIKDGFDRNTITELYGSPRVYFETKGISLFLTHREAKLNYGQFVSPKLIKRARRYMEKHEPVLSKTEREYGVNKEVITAIILVETQLGTILGGPSTLNTLSSMASLSDPVVRDIFWVQVSGSAQISKERFEKWVKRKSKWAYKELKVFLEYTARENIDPTSIKGSYAGAMGIAQFMPSSIYAYAKDGNYDGRIDLFNHSDAITSVANYLKHYGWHQGIDRKEAYKVIYHYNHSNQYVETVFKVSELLKG